LTTIPRRAARLIPPMIATGVARISGHGVATTSTARKRAESPERSQAAAARARVKGVNHTATRSAMRCTAGRSRWAAAIRRTTCW
jgi:hypothetical protein